MCASTCGAFSVFHPVKNPLMVRDHQNVNASMCGSVKMSVRALVGIFHVSTSVIEQHVMEQRFRVSSEVPHSVFTCPGV